MASAGTVTVDFAAETAKFTAELKKVNASIGRMEDRLTAFDKIGRQAFRFFTAGAVLTFARSAIQAGDALGDAAERAGIAVESFSRLQFAAGRADVEVSAFTAGITKFQVAVSKASEGNKEALGAFSALNIEISKLSGLSIEQQLGIVADAFAAVKDPADRTRLAIQFFGKAAGPQFVPFLAQGSEGMRKFAEQADRLGITMTESAAKGLDRATKATEGFIAAVKLGIASRFGDLVTSVFGSGDQIVDLEFRLKSLSALLKGLELAPVPDTERIRVVTEEIRQLTVELGRVQNQASKFTLLPLPWINALEEIDLTALEALKIKVNELDASFKTLDQTIAAIRQARVTEALEISTQDVLAQQTGVERLVTEELEKELEKRSAATQAHRQFELQQELAVQQALQQIRATTINLAIGALQMFAGKSKKVAIALVLINKARAIASVIQDTAAASVKALAVLGPVAGPPVAAAFKAYGAAQIALIAASGVGEIQQINRSGGAPVGSPSNPVFTSNQSTDGGGQAGATPRSAVQVIVQGNIVGNQEFIDDLIDQISDAVDDKDVILIKPTSRNAQELVGA